MFRRCALSVGVVYCSTLGPDTVVVPDVARIISLATHIPIIVKQKYRIPNTNASQTYYTTVSLGPENDVNGKFTRNSIMLLPSLLTPSECKELINDTEQSFNDGVAVEDDGCLARLQVQDLSSRSQQIDATIRARLLTFLESELPSETAQIFGVETKTRSSLGSNSNGSSNSTLQELTPSYSSLEPAVNRYTTGGKFEAHEDGYSITINILLDSSSFTGGGTEFWEEKSDREANTDTVGPTLRIEPVVPGCAVIFNGNVRHQGRTVHGGVRYLYVSSFDLN